MCHGGGDRWQVEWPPGLQAYLLNHALGPFQCSVEFGSMEPLCTSGNLPGSFLLASLSFLFFFDYTATCPLQLWTQLKKGDCQARILNSGSYLGGLSETHQFLSLVPIFPWGSDPDWWQNPSLKGSTTESKPRCCGNRVSASSCVCSL